MEQVYNLPKFRGMSHQLMFFVSIIACALLIYKSSNPNETVATLVYSLGLLSMFGFSALYHRTKTTIKIKKRLQKLDHSGIFLMIAGTFTPICLLALPNENRLMLLIIIWCVAFVGIIQSIFFSKTHRLIRALIYLIAGWVALPFMPMLVASLDLNQLVLVIAGGIIYSLGAIGYGFKVPKLVPMTFGFHEFFHLLVIIAASLHFIVIYGLL
tara:strand:+ start:5919 stop:6554 length:636 start_codon:yes stop_codon:yes gene_type:complete